MKRVAPGLRAACPMQRDRRAAISPAPQGRDRDRKASRPARCGALQGTRARSPAPTWSSADSRTAAEGIATGSGTDVDEEMRDAFERSLKNFKPSQPQQEEQGWRVMPHVPPDTINPQRPIAAGANSLICLRFRAGIALRSVPEAKRLKRRHAAHKTGTLKTFPGDVAL